MSFNSALVNNSDNAEWATPQALFDGLNAEFRFTLDPCSSEENHKCKKYYTKEQDGLAQNWDGENVFINPPYRNIYIPGLRRLISAMQRL